ncbi:MAG: tetratricopeptide repeat protein, partial [Candidatus Obscuribacterales bacterium]|nr:tetratricopeptide repeat protein [Candidatus Obscuribacterales bacterium]
MKKLALASILFVIAAPVMADSDSAPVNENHASAGSNASDLLRQGQSAYQQKDYAQAETNWKKAIEIASKDGDNKSKAESMCGLAIVYTKQARVGDAKKASDEAIRFITSTFGESDPRLGLLRKLSEGASSACVAPSVDESGADWMKYMQAGTDA